MLLALVLALIATAGGALGTYLFDDEVPPPARLCAGIAIGLAVLGLAGFVFASFMGLGFASLALAALLVASPLLILRDRERARMVSADLHGAARSVRRAVLHPTLRTSSYVIFYALAALLLWLVFDRVMVEQSDGIYTGVLNNYGDLPFHLSVITRFTEGANFPPEDPTWAGARFTYPFMVDFVAACFVRAGATLRQAIFLENFLLALSFLGLLHRFTVKLTRDWLAGLIAPALVLFSGGMGWLLLFSDKRWGRLGLSGTLLNLQQVYTDDASGYSWGNSLTTLLVPQRGILFGLPLALIVFTLWWATPEEGKSKKAKSKSKAGPRPSKLSLSSFLLSPPAKRFFAAGVVAGLLPLVHAHTFVVVMAVGGVLALVTGLKEWRAWALFFAAAVVIGAPQMLWATSGTSVRGGDFTGWHFGWDMKEGDNFLWFWLKNTGLFIPLLLTALLWPGRRGDEDGRLIPRRLLYFYLPFTLCFVVPNLLKLAPWVWDNIKVLFYWFVASAPIVALLLARWLRESWWTRALAIPALLALVLAGALDVWAVASRASEFRIFDADGVAFAELIKEKTPGRSTVLHAPTFDTPVFLTGRRSVMGYPGHIGSHGIKYEERQLEVARIYAGTTDAEALMMKYGVSYVVLGPHEREEMGKLGSAVNDQFFSRYQFVGDSGPYRLYKIARP